MSKALEDVTAERFRQISEEGWSTAHDDEHDWNDLAKAAAAYSLLTLLPSVAVNVWPFDGTPKDKGHRRNCVRAAALLLAEIERLDRSTDVRASE